MADVEVMARAVGFIEARLQEPVGVAQMAEAVSYSLYHFCRTFHAATHHTPYDYLMRRRVAEAARDLLGSECTVTEVAFAYQFNSLETFSRAFRRVMGTQPSQWRKQGQAGYRQIMPPLTEAHLHHVRRCAPWRPAVEERPALRLGGMVAVGPPGSVEAAAWDWLRSALEDPCTGAHDFYGLYLHAPGGSASTGAPVAATMAAVALHDSSMEGTALVTKTLPPLHYAHFAHRGAACDVELTLDYVYHTWLPQSAYRAALPLYLIHYGPEPRLDAPADEAWEVWVPVEARPE